MNSPKSIIEKLNLTKYPSRLVMNKPDDIGDLDSIDFDDEIKHEKYDVIFSFIFNMIEFKQRIEFIIDKSLLNNKGYIYFAYPKKDNPQYKEYIHRDSFFEELTVDEDGYYDGTDIKFSKMVSMNDVFTVIGLKLEKKKATKSSSPKSQTVDDYIQYIEDLKEFLKGREDVLEKYNQLTFGYQKDWARYVYSAKRKETQDKRLEEMVMILSEGYKSKDLYKRGVK